MNNDIIIFDVETTGLDLPMPAALDRQPYLTEIYAVRLTKDFKFVAEINTMVKPPIPISKEITAITGINDESVANAPNFIQIYDELYDIFDGCRYGVGHNVGFDIRILHFELFRYDFEHNFNWPKYHVCTVEGSRHYENKRLKLMQLYTYLFGKEFVGAHRAKNDVEATAACFKEMIKRGDITLKEK